VDVDREQMEFIYLYVPVDPSMVQTAVFCVVLGKNTVDTFSLLYQEPNLIVYYISGHRIKPFK
jgi:hypothetical protein